MCCGHWPGLLSAFLKARLSYKSNTHKSLIVTETRVHMLQLSLSICYYFPHIGHISAFWQGTSHRCLSIMPSFSVISANITISDISLKTRFFGLHFRCKKSWCIFNHFYVRYRIRWKKGKVTAITPFKVIQGHRFWYQSKAHMRLPISD